MKFRNGYGKACAVGESELILNNPGIKFSPSEGASSILYWDDAAGNFKRFWTSD